MPHPQSSQNLFAPRSTHEYHVQIFSKEHGDWLSSSIHVEPSDASETAAIIEKGFKGQKGARAPKVRVVKVAKHTVYSEPEEVAQKQSAVDMAPADRRKLDRMVADQAKGPNAGRRTGKAIPRNPAKPKRQIVDLSDAVAPKKKGK
jgi:hypothetical protein